MKPKDTHLSIRNDNSTTLENGTPTENQQIGQNKLEIYRWQNYERWTVNDGHPKDWNGKMADEVASLRNKIVSHQGVGDKAFAKIKETIVNCLSKLENHLKQTNKGFGSIHDAEILVGVSNLQINFQDYQESAQYSEKKESSRTSMYADALSLEKACSTANQELLYTQQTAGKEFRKLSKPQEFTKILTTLESVNEILKEVKNDFETYQSDFKDDAKKIRNGQRVYNFPRRLYEAKTCLEQILLNMQKIKIELESLGDNFCGKSAESAAVYVGWRLAITKDNTKDAVQQYNKGLEHIKIIINSRHILRQEEHLHNTLNELWDQRYEKALVENSLPSERATLMTRSWDLDARQWENHLNAPDMHSDLGILHKTVVKPLNNIYSTLKSSLEHIESQNNDGLDNLRDVFPNNNEDLNLKKFTHDALTKLKRYASDLLTTIDTQEQEIEKAYRKQMETVQDNEAHNDTASYIKYVTEQLQNPHSFPPEYEVLLNTNHPLANLAKNGIRRIKEKRENCQALIDYIQKEQNRRVVAQRGRKIPKVTRRVIFPKRTIINRRKTQ